MYHLKWVRTDMVLPLFHIEIVARQGVCPLLRVTVAKKDYTPQTGGTVVTLMKDTMPLFRGTLRAPITQATDDFVLLVVDGGTTNRRQQCAKMLGPFQDKATVDLLYPEDKREDPFHCLAWAGCVPHMDLLGTVSLKNMDDETGPLHKIGGQFFKTSLTMQHHPARYGGGCIKIRVEWMQRYDGVAALGPLIGRIDTLTPEALQRAWWRPAQTVLKRGYHLLKSKLEPYENNKPFLTHQGKNVPVYQLRPTLTLNWYYRQKRVETVTWTWGDTHSHALTVPIHLQDISAPLRLPCFMAGQPYKPGMYVVVEGVVYRCMSAHTAGDHFQADHWRPIKRDPCALEKPHSWTFFQTKAGACFLKQVVAMGHLLQRGMQPFLEVGVTVPLDMGLRIQPFHRVTLTDKRLPDGQLCGVVHKVHHVIEGDLQHGYSELTVRIRPPLLSPTFKGLQVTEAAQGVLHPDQLTARDLVQEMAIQNQAPDQLAHVGPAHDMAALRQYVTRVRLRLKALTRQPTLYHGWRICVK